MRLRIIKLMRTANGNSLTCGASALNSRRRRTRWSARISSAAALLCLTLGPTTGIVHAVHLAHADHDHDANNCSVCQQLVLTSKYLLDPPAEMSAALNPHQLVANGLVTTFVPQSVPLNVLPRGPPSTFVL